NQNNSPSNECSICDNMPKRRYNMSKNITIDNSLLSIASNNMAVTAMLSVSVE
ncbi:Hypothetical predicted protein, partial [Paramuricea clavata]